MKYYLIDKIPIQYSMNLHLFYSARHPSINVDIDHFLLEEQQQSTETLPALYQSKN